MKHGKRPTRRQKIYLDTHGYYHPNWLVSQDTPEAMIIQHRKNGRVECVPKESQKT